MPGPADGMCTRARQAGPAAPLTGFIEIGLLYPLILVPTQLLDSLGIWFVVNQLHCGSRVFTPMAYSRQVELTTKERTGRSLRI